MQGGAFFRFKRFSGIVGCDVCEGFFPECSLVLVIAFQEGLEYACAAQRGKPIQRRERRMELKGITCRIPLELHNRISGEIREMGSTMGQFIEMIIREHYEKGEKKMIEKGRTLAFQVSEELFQKVKEYLAWYEKTYHRRLTQKEFVIGLIEEALEEMEAEMEKESQESEAPAEQNGARSWDQEEPTGEEEEDYIVENNWDETEDGEDEDGTHESDIEDQDEEAGTDNTDESDELSDTEEICI